MIGRCFYRNRTRHGSHTRRGGEATESSITRPRWATCKPSAMGAGGALVLIVAGQLILLRYGMRPGREARPWYDERYKQLFAYPRMVETCCAPSSAVTISAHATSRRCRSCRRNTSATSC